MRDFFFYFERLLSHVKERSHVTRHTFCQRLPESRWRGNAVDMTKPSCRFPHSLWPPESPMPPSAAAARHPRVLLPFTSDTLVRAQRSSDPPARAAPARPWY